MLLPLVSITFKKYILIKSSTFLGYPGKVLMSLGQSEKIKILIKSNNYNV